ncbi:MAG: hypothetical protein GY950_18665, partial [bacterium]|nr:hypothetical protein [bacterium]
VFQKSPLGYHTGDLAKWLPDGTIEFLGRKDQQVKIRGFRIEPGEIESCLIRHEAVREAVVIDREDGSGDRYLCAYVVPERAAQDSQDSERLLEEVLRDCLVKVLPDYMIPVYYVQLEKIPLTFNGKVDRRALPAPRFAAGAGYIAPVTALEKTLARMWADVLDVDIDVIGLNANFFQLGGHSLKATQLMVRINKELNVGISLGRMFESPRLDQMADAVAQAEQSIYQSVQPIEKREYYDVSTAQAGHNIHYRFEEKQGPFNFVSSMEMDDVDRDALERAFETLVKRHESLRTTFLWVGGEVKQKVHPYNALGFEVEYIDLRGLRREKAVRGRVDRYMKEARGILFDFIEGPLLDVKLLHLADSKYFLVFSMHHVMSDGWSAGVMTEELRAIYTAYDQGHENPLPPMRVQFKDYVTWNRRMLNPENRSRLREFWHSRLNPLPPEVTLTTRFADKAAVRGRVDSYRVQMRREIQDFYKGLTPPEEELFFGAVARVKPERGSSYVFTVAGETLGALKKLAADTDTGLFAVLSAGFNILFHRLTGENDIIIGFNSVTRDHDDLENLIGFLLNTLLLRTEVDNRLPVDKFTMRTARAVTAANDHRAYPFEQLLYELDIPLHAVGTVFLNMLNFQQDPTGTIHDFAPHYYKKGGSPYFDIDYHINEYSNGISFACDFKRDLFKRDTIAFINREYVRLLQEIAADPGKKIMELSL